MGNRKEREGVEDEVKARRIKTTEHSEQVALFQWAAFASGKYPALRYMFAIPNGAKLPWYRKEYKGKVVRRSPEAMRLKSEGLKPGVPDIMLPAVRGGYAGLYIEMKAEKNIPTPTQKEYHDYLRAEGYEVAVCYGCDEAIVVIQGYLCGKLSKMRETPAGGQR